MKPEQEAWRLIQNPPPEAYEDKPLSQKQLERIKAFELRAELRREAGRPD